MDIDIVKITKNLVSIESTNPGKYEGEVFDYIMELLYPFKEEMDIVSHEVMPERSNIMATVAGKNCKKEMVFICHMDTVSLGEGWDSNPTVPLEKDGKIYARGSCDMKSGLACGLAGLFHALELKRSNKLAINVKFIATVDEEGNMQGVESVINEGWVSKDSMIMDTEPTNGHIQGSHKGRAWFRLTVHGIKAHAATPWEGIDANLAMAELMLKIKSKIKLLDKDSEMGETTLVFGTVHGGADPYVVSDICTATVDIRLAYPNTMDNAKDIINSSINEIKASYPGVRAEYEITGDKPYIKLDTESKLYKLLYKSVKAVTGDIPKVSCFNGYTDTAVIAARLGNRNCISYGPGSLSMAHKPNEYVPVEDILRCERVLTELVDRLG